MYIVGRAFKSNLGQHQVGDELTDEVVESWRTYRSLVSCRILYKVESNSKFNKMPPHLSARYKRNRALVKASTMDRGAGEHEKPEIVKEAEKARDAVLESTLLANRSHAQKIEDLREAKVEKLKEPIKVKQKPVPVDEPKTEAEEVASEFDPEKVRSMKLEDLKEIAEERGLKKSGNKPEIAQRIIDDEIEKNK